jgi:hypothetical protein
MCVLNENSWGEIVRSHLTSNQVKFDIMPCRMYAYHVVMHAADSFRRSVRVLLTSYFRRESMLNPGKWIFTASHRTTQNLMIIHPWISCDYVINKGNPSWVQFQMLSHVFSANCKQIHHMAASFIGIYAAICESSLLAITMTRPRNPTILSDGICTRVLWITRWAIFIALIMSCGRSSCALKSLRLIVPHRDANVVYETEYYEPNRILVHFTFHPISFFYVWSSPRWSQSAQKVSRRFIVCVESRLEMVILCDPSP